MNSHQCALVVEGGAAFAMLKGVAGEEGRRITLAVDCAYDTADFMMETHEPNATPHIAHMATGRHSAIDERTTRHPGCATRQRMPKRIEEFFGCAKAATGLRKTKCQCLTHVRFAFTLAAAAYNLICLLKLLTARAVAS